MIGISHHTSLPRRLKIACGRTETYTCRSPLGPPFAPALPLPTFRIWSSSMPAGIVIFDRFLPAQPPLAVAGPARRLDDLAAAAAAVARADRLHDAERRALVDAHLTASAAVRAAFRACALLCAGAAAVRAARSGGTSPFFLQPFAASSKETTTFASTSVPRRGAFGFARRASRRSRRRKAVENIAEIKAARAAGIRVSAACAAAEIRVHTRKAELIVPRALILVGKHLVRLVDLLKLRLGRLVAGV